MGQRPLEGIKVIEVSMWAFVPSCGAVLSDSWHPRQPRRSPGITPVNERIVCNAR